MLKDQKQSWEPQGEPVCGTADRLLKATGDILDAVILARFYGWIAFQPDDWNEVRHELAAVTVTEEATGIENWQEPAPEGWVNSLPTPEGEVVQQKLKRLRGVMRTLTLRELLESLKPKGRYVQVACDHKSGLMFYVIRQLEKGWDRKIAGFILDDAAEEVIQRWREKGHGEIMDGPYCSTFCNVGNYEEIMKGICVVGGSWRESGEGSGGGIKSGDGP